MSAFRLTGLKPRFAGLVIRLNAQQSGWQVDELKWSIHLSIPVAWSIPLAAAEGRSCGALGLIIIIIIFVYYNCSQTAQSYSTNIHHAGRETTAATQGSTIHKG